MLPLHRCLSKVPLVTVDAEHTKGDLGTQIEHIWNPHHLQHMYGYPAGFGG